MTDQSIDISGLPKEAVLAGLFNNATSQGLGRLHDSGEGMTLEQAAELVEQLGDRLSFDYLAGRVMKVDLSGDEVDPWGYDRDNGQGKARQVIDAVRATIERGANGAVQPSDNTPFEFMEVWGQVLQELAHYEARVIIERPEEFEPGTLRLVLQQGDEQSQDVLTGALASTSVGDDDRGAIVEEPIVFEPPQQEGGFASAHLRLHTILPAGTERELRITQVSESQFGAISASGKPWRWGLRIASSEQVLQATGGVDISETRPLGTQGI